MRQFFTIEKIFSNFRVFLKDGLLIKILDDPDSDLNMGCRSKSEKFRSRSKNFNRDPAFSNFDPKRVAIGGRIENRIETISNTQVRHGHGRRINSEPPTFKNVEKTNSIHLS
jgi:hypothetical protein